MAKKGRQQPVKAKSGVGRLATGLVRRRPIANGTRQRKATRLQKRKYTKKTTRSYKPIPGNFKLIGQVFSTFKQYWRPLGGIVLVYLLLNIIFASGLSNVGSAFNEIKFELQAQGGGQFLNALGGFGSLVGSAGVNSSETASVLQAVLFALESLVIIWALRHLLAGQAIKVKQAYYGAMMPLVPFLLVSFVMILQLLPITFGSFIIAAIVSTIFTAGSAATVIMTIIILGLAVWSIYMLSSSVFALYIVTLPEMEPRKALRSAKNLVRFRRLAVIRRVLFLPLFILLVMGLLIIPLILYVDVLVAPVFFVLSMLAILFIHTYLYSLYRGLLE